MCVCVCVCRHLSVTDTWALWQTPWKCQTNFLESRAQRGRRGAAWMNEYNYNCTQCTYTYANIYAHVCVCVPWSNNGVCRVQQNAWINKNSIWIESSREKPSSATTTEWYFMRHLLNLKSQTLSPNPSQLPRIVSYKSMRIHAAEENAATILIFRPLQHVGFCNFPRLRFGIGTIGRCSERQTLKIRFIIQNTEYVNVFFGFPIQMIRIRVYSYLS